MDINPYQFEAPFDEFEFAQFIKREQAIADVQAARPEGGEPCWLVRN